MAEMDARSDQRAKAVATSCAAISKVDELGLHLKTDGEETASNPAVVGDGVGAD